VLQDLVEYFLKLKIPKLQNNGMANTSVCQLMTTAVPFGGTIKTAIKPPHNGRLLRTTPPILNPVSNLLWLILELKTLTI